MTEDKSWYGISRDNIDWYPSIDYAKCTGCMSCVRKCTYGVYSEEGDKPKVVKPKNCLVGCTGCERVCPQGAISHPPRAYLQNLAKNSDIKLCTCGGDCE